MRADLRNLATGEEAYFYDHAIYSNQLDSMKLTTSNSNIVTVTEFTATGWSATSQNRAVVAALLRCSSERRPRLLRRPRRES